ncbi:MAG: hypothetical protein DA407_06310 [Bacteroidetes bacterium]|nr:MAG: hypothetical protein DA407_06310 [Bacteroidota bacterium]
MITRFFSTSKPIHLVLVSFFVLGLFLVVRLGYYSERITATQILKELLLYSITVLSIFVLSFFVNKNNLTKQNSFKILFFSLFLACIPETIQHGNIIISNVFILFAIRRIISLRSNLYIKKKLFDAAFWIALASLFYFWAILFLLLVFAALIFYSIGQVNNWIIPLVGILTVVLIVISYFIIVENSFGDVYLYIDGLSFDFSNYNQLSLIISITIILSLGIWALFFYVRKLQDKSRAYRPSFILIFIALIIGVTIVVLATNKNGSEFIFMFAPLAIILTNYIESIKETWFAEVFVWLLVITPIAQLVL